jgi:hypothetical protein
MPRRVRPFQQPPLELPLEGVSPTAVRSGVTQRLPDHVAAAAFLAANATVERQFAATVDVDMWRDSPFAWLRTLPTSRRSKAAIALCEHMFRGIGFSVGDRQGAGHDVLVAGRTVRVKFSTLWATGMYTFQQIPVVGYDVLVLIGVSPMSAHVWVVPVDDLAHYAARDGSLGLEIDPADPPDWLGSGDLSALPVSAALSFGAPVAPHGPVAALLRVPDPDVSSLGAFEM